MSQSPNDWNKAKMASRQQSLAQEAASQGSRAWYKPHVLQGFVPSKTCAIHHSQPVPCFKPTTNPQLDAVTDEVLWDPK